MRSPAVFRRTYRDDPLAFVHDCVEWPSESRPAPYQEEVLGELPRRRRVCLRGPHGLGKTALASWVVLWFALTSDGAGTDWKAPCTASAWRQLTHYLWPEIRKWARRVRWDRVGRPALDERSEALNLSLRLRDGEAFAVASDTPALIEGAHAGRLLYVFDEAKSIPDATFDAAEGAFSTGDASALAISTPGEPQGRFYAIQARRPGFEDWWVRAVTAEEAIGAGRMLPEWAEQRRRQWGEQSAIYRNRVLGEFAASEADGVIPLAWVEAANRRWFAWDAAGRPGSLTAVGVDVARSGEDQTVLALRRGDAVGELRRYTRQDTMATAGRVKGLLDREGGRAVVDVIGLGAGVVDRLREQKCDVEAFNAAAQSDLRDRSGELGFANRRAEAWWGLRERLDPELGDGLMLPADELLTGDLVAPRWRVVSGGRILIESKDDLRKRLGRSTNDGDAVVQAFAVEQGVTRFF